MRLYLTKRQEASEKFLTVADMCCDTLAPCLFSATVIVSTISSNCTNAELKGGIIAIGFNQGRVGFLYSILSTKVVLLRK